MTMFANNPPRILIVQETASGHNPMEETLHSLGFTNVIKVDDAAAVLEFLKSGAIDWIITPLFLEHEINALHILKTATEHSELRQTRVSLLYKPSDERYLEAAFSLGLMSCHPSDASKEDLHASLKRLIDLFSIYKTQPNLVSAEFLRQHLIAQKLFSKLVQLENKLLDFYPGTAMLLTRLGEAQLLAGDFESGTRTLNQAGILDERFKGVLQSISKSIGKFQEINLRQVGVSTNALRLESCVIIDPDTAALSTIRSILTNLGVRKIQVFDDGAEAWQWLQSNPEPSLILQEWKIPRLPGPILMQKIRQHGFTNTMIIAMSASIKPSEAFLLRELGVDHVIPKPFGQKLFIKNLIWAVQQNVNPTEQKSLERKIHRHLEKLEIVGACRRRETLIHNPKISNGAKKYISAEFAFYAGKYLLARDMGIESLKLSGDSIVVLNLIGRSLLKLGDFSSALKFFEKLSHLSPLNIEHLSHLAITLFEVGDLVKSEQALQKAKTLDPTNERILSIDCEHAIIHGAIDRAKELLSLLGVKIRAEIFLKLQDRALGLLRHGNHETGIKLYQSLSLSIPSDLKDLQDSIGYNLGLAYANSGALDKAQSVLRPLLKRMESLYRAKASALLQRIEDSLKDETTLVPIPMDKDADMENPNKLAVEDLSMIERTLVSGYEVQEGEIGLFGLFDSGLDLPEVKNTLASVPHFITKKSA